MHKVCTYKRFGIYERNAKEIHEFESTRGEQSKYAAFLPEETPGMLCEPEWETDSMQEMRDFIDSYNKY